MEEAAIDAFGLSLGIAIGIKADPDGLGLSSFSEQPLTPGGAPERMKILSWRKRTFFAADSRRGWTLTNIKYYLISALFQRFPSAAKRDASILETALVFEAAGRTRSFKYPEWIFIEDFHQSFDCTLFMQIGNKTFIFK